MVGSSAKTRFCQVGSSAQTAFGQPFLRCSLVSGPNKLLAFRLKCSFANHFQEHEGQEEANKGWRFGLNGALPTFFMGPLDVGIKKKVGNYAERVICQVGSSALIGFCPLFSDRCLVEGTEKELADLPK